MRNRLLKGSLTILAFLAIAVAPVEAEIIVTSSNVFNIPVGSRFADDWKPNLPAGGRVEVVIGNAGGVIVSKTFLGEGNSTDLLDQIGSTRRPANGLRND